MKSMSIPYILQCTIQYNALCHAIKFWSVCCVGLMPWVSLNFEQLKVSENLKSGLPDYKKVNVSQCHFRIESKHQRWSSWSPSRPTFGCFDSMEVKSRFVLKMAFWILTKKYIWYSFNSCLRFTWSDRFHNEFDFFVAWDDLHRKSVTFPLSGYWNYFEKGGLYVLLATRPSSKIFRVGYE